MKGATPKESGLLLASHLVYSVSAHLASPAANAEEKLPVGPKACGRLQWDLKRPTPSRLVYTVSRPKACDRLRLERRDQVDGTPLLISEPHATRHTASIDKGAGDIPAEEG